MTDVFWFTRIDKVVDTSRMRPINGNMNMNIMVALQKF